MATFLLLLSVLLLCLFSSTTSLFLHDRGVYVKRITINQTRNQASMSKDKNVRRQLLCRLVVVSAAATATPSASAQAALFESRERRQLELCLVNLLRVIYWAQSVVERLSANDDDEQQRKQVYLEARVGAKAILTSKISTGNPKIYTLSTLQISDCLQDLEYYQPSIGALKQEWREALAALVEFDALDSLTDPSPRTTLFLTQYTVQKEVYVIRLLKERVIVIGERIVATFDNGAVQRAKTYVNQYYSSEIPATMRLEG